MKENNGAYLYLRDRNNSPSANPKGSSECRLTALKKENNEKKNIQDQRSPISENAP